MDREIIFHLENGNKLYVSYEKGLAVFYSLENEKWEVSDYQRNSFFSNIISVKEIAPQQAIFICRNNSPVQLLDRLANIRDSVEKGNRINPQG